MMGNLNLMDGIAILERIVTEEGSCTWASSIVCKKCPLGRLVKADGSRHVSCVEAINIEGLSEEEADARYKETATNKLAELVLDDAIRTD
jgi:hypothetical protein